MIANPARRCYLPGMHETTNQRHRERMISKIAILCACALIVYAWLWFYVAIGLAVEWILDWLP